MRIPYADGRCRGAPGLSEELGMTASFTAKILRKLMLAELVRSIRGAGAGFALPAHPKTRTLRNIIETIDGAFAIRRCLMGEHNCSYQKTCRFHCVFEELNRMIISRLDMLTLADMTGENIPVSKLIERLTYYTDK